MEENYNGLTIKGKKIYTALKNGKIEYWDPYSSKPAAAITNGLQNFPVKHGQKILYLGAAHGTTISHFSNIVGVDGSIFGVEFSGKVISELLKKAGKKKNIIPLLEDAHYPEKYGWVGLVDFVYEDVAQRDQIAILKRNAEVFLKSGGFIAVALKAKSIDSVRDVKEIYKEAIIELSETFEIIETVILDPFERDHMFIVGRAKV
jgi:fibrillarin-like pre-rRNA processing protein